MLNGRPFAVNEVIVVGVRGKSDRAVIDFRVLVEQGGKCLELLFPVRHVHVYRGERERGGRFRFPREVGRCVFFIHLNRAVRLHLDEALDGRFVFLIRLEPYNASKRIDIVVDRHQHWIRKSRTGIRAALAANLVRAVQVVVADANIHV